MNDDKSLESFVSESLQLNTFSGKAYELLEELTNLDPIIASEQGGYLSCYFCGEWFVSRESGSHSPDCLYVRAKQLIED